MSKQTSIVFWNWKETAGNLASARSSSARYWGQFALMVVMGGILYGRFGHCVAAGMVWGLSAGLLFGILFCDKVLRGFDKTGHLLAVAAGTGLTWILLTPAFYILFGLGRLLIKISGKDPMQRTVDPHAKSYWTAPKKITIESRYHKQF